MHYYIDFPVIYQSYKDGFYFVKRLVKQYGLSPSVSSQTESPNIPATMSTKTISDSHINPVDIIFPPLYLNTVLFFLRHASHFPRFHSAFPPECTNCFSFFDHHNNVEIDFSPYKIISNGDDNDGANCMCCSGDSDPVLSVTPSFTSVCGSCVIPSPNNSVRTDLSEINRKSVKLQSYAPPVRLEVSNSGGGCSSSVTGNEESKNKKNVNSKTPFMDNTLSSVGNGVVQQKINMDRCEDDILLTEKAEDEFFDNQVFSNVRFNRRSASLSSTSYLGFPKRSVSLGNLFSPNCTLTNASTPISTPLTISNPTSYMSNPFRVEKKERLISLPVSSFYIPSNVGSIFMGDVSQPLPSSMFNMYSSGNNTPKSFEGIKGQIDIHTQTSPSLETATTSKQALRPTFVFRLPGQTKKHSQIHRRRGNSKFIVKKEVSRNEDKEVGEAGEDVEDDDGSDRNDDDYIERRKRKILIHPKLLIHNMKKKNHPRNSGVNNQEEGGEKKDLSSVRDSENMNEDNNENMGESYSEDRDIDGMVLDSGNFSGGEGDVFHDISDSFSIQNTDYLMASSNNDFWHLQKHRRSKSQSSLSSGSSLFHQAKRYKGEEGNILNAHSVHVYSPTSQSTTATPSLTIPFSGEIGGVDFSSFDFGSTNISCPNDNEANSCPFVQTDQMLGHSSNQHATLIFAHNQSSLLFPESLGNENVPRFGNNPDNSSSPFNNTLSSSISQNIFTFPQSHTFPLLFNNSFPLQSPASVSNTQTQSSVSTAPFHSNILQSRGNTPSPFYPSLCSNSTGFNMDGGVFNDNLYNNQSDNVVFGSDNQGDHSMGDGLIPSELAEFFNSFK
jgi:hypothetical protein